MSELTISGPMIGQLSPRIGSHWLKKQTQTPPDSLSVCQDSSTEIMNTNENFENNSTVDDTSNDATEEPKKDLKDAVAVMGKLKDDMIFLEKIANSKTLSTNLLDAKYMKKTRGSRMKIQNAADDGLSFLKVRSNFWETSGTELSTNPSSHSNESGSKKKRS